MLLASRCSHFSFFSFVWKFLRLDSFGPGILVGRYLEPIK